MTGKVHMRILMAGWMLLLVSATLPAQEEPPLDKIRVQVNLVSLDVEVLDRKGNLVPGLTRPDFVVEEDGKPMEITSLHQSRRLEKERERSKFCWEMGSYDSSHYGDS